MLVLENFATRRRISAPPLACAMVGFFDRWRRIEELFDHLPAYSPRSLRQAVSILARHTLLDTGRNPRARPAARLDSWREWNPAAGFFHFSTKDAKFVVGRRAMDRFYRERRRLRPIPPSRKRYTDARQTALPPARRDSPLGEVLLKRRTWRRFSAKPISLVQLGTLLGLSAGVQGWVDTPHTGRLPLKTSPSGGARHTIELYVLALGVTGLTRGLYHYDADSHRLELLRRGASARQVTRFLAGQAWFRRAAALVLMTAVMPRSQWKYPDPRAYRVVLADAGHLCQTFCLVATSEGLAPFCTMALADSEIERALGIDGVKEVILYAAGVGSMPRDGVPDTEMAGRIEWKHVPLGSGRRGGG